MRTFASSNTFIVGFVTAGLCQSSNVISAIGAPPMGVAAWQPWQLVDTALATPQGTIPGPAAMGASGATGDVGLAPEPAFGVEIGLAGGVVPVPTEPGGRAGVTLPVVPAAVAPGSTEGGTYDPAAPMPTAGAI